MKNLVYKKIFVSLVVTLTVFAIFEKISEATPYYNQGMAFNRTKGNNYILSSGAAEAMFYASGTQRKLAYVNSNWYAFYEDGAGNIVYKKAGADLVWGAAVTISAGANNVNPSIWVKNSLIYVSWFNTGGSSIRTRTIDTASADTLGATCNNVVAALGTTARTSVAVSTSNTVYLALSDGTNNYVRSLNYGTCTATDINPVASKAVDYYEDYDISERGIVGCFANPTGGIGAGRGPIGGALTSSFRFPLTTFPAAATITDAKLLYNIFDHGNCGGLTGGGNDVAIDIQAYNQTGQTDPQADIGTCSTVKTRNTNDASPYLSNDTTTFDTIGLKTITFPAGSYTDIQAAKAAVNRFSIGMSDGTGMSGTSKFTCGDGVSGPTTATRMRLRLTFTSAPAITTGWPTLLALGNNIHMIWGDGNLSHAVFDGTDWQVADKSISADNVSNFSAATDGTSIWILGQFGTSEARLYTCATCSATNPIWAASTAAFTGATNLNSVSLTYRAGGSLDAIVIKDASERIYYKNSPASTIAWSPQKVIKDLAGDFGHVTSPMSLPAASGLGGMAYRRTTTYRFYQY